MEIGSCIAIVNANIFAGLDSALRPSGYDTVPYPMRNAAERHDFFADLPVRRNADAVIVSSFDIGRLKWSD